MSLTFLGVFSHDSSAFYRSIAKAIQPGDSTGSPQKELCLMKKYILIILSTHFKTVSKTSEVYTLGPGNTLLSTASFWDM